MQDDRGPPRRHTFEAVDRLAARPPALPSTPPTPAWSGAPPPDAAAEAEADAGPVGRPAGVGTGRALLRLTLALAVPLAVLAAAGLGLRPRLAAGPARLPVTALEAPGPDLPALVRRLGALEAAQAAAVAQAQADRGRFEAALARQDDAVAALRQGLDVPPELQADAIPVEDPPIPLPRPAPRPPG